ncbi:MAG: glycosyltransferase [Deltaproteobacteria bacterium]|nr:glycosyltransferase [Deltaproteobacteria bacterium]
MSADNNLRAEDNNWALEHIKSRKEYVRGSYEKIADIREKWIDRNRYFYNKLSSFLNFIIEPGKKILLFRSELGQLLPNISPASALGVDICQKMVSFAKRKYPQFRFKCADPEDIELDEKFDYIVFYSLGDIIDIEKAFINAGAGASVDTRLIVINYNYLWRPLVFMAEKIGWKVPQPTQNWLNIPVIENILYLSGYEVVKKYHQVLFPVGVPILSWFLNDAVAKLPFIKNLCFLQIVVAKKIAAMPAERKYSVSVIVPCKNEKGNVEDAVRRIPEMGKGTEIIFCDDKSTDGTVEEIKRMMALYPEKNIKVVPGPGICKAKNVWTGFDAASGDILMILDADLTVIPEELPYFYNAIAEGRGEFINGSRMIYPMQDQAMRTLNIIGNKFFSLSFSYLLGQRLTDTLCGTKVLWRKDWPRVKALLGSWGVSDRWGDYELIFGAAKLHLKIVEVPVHYLERVYGETKMTKRLQNGLVMLRMCVAALKKFKFV